MIADVNLTTRSSQEEKLVHKKNNVLSYINQFVFNQFNDAAEMRIIYKREIKFLSGSYFKTF